MTPAVPATAPTGPAVVGHLAAALGPARYHGVQAWVVVGLCVVATLVSGLRWLRVAQREHYLPGSASVFAVRWWRSTPLNAALAAVGLLGAVDSLLWPPSALLAAAVAVAAPEGLGLRGRTSPLAWTRRLRTLAAVWVVLVAVVVVAGSVVGPAAPAAALVLVGAAPLVDLACRLTWWPERRLSERFVRQATARLARVAPTVVAITGSYGKTSTKGHLAHLVGTDRVLVATPASFNNRAGLARSVNEHLADGTQVFVAEMGTYGPGEIADLCAWCPPDIAVITAIGPVHLERFGSEDRIVEAKSEILVPAADVVLAVDDQRLAAVADTAEGRGKRVQRVSALDPEADVCVTRDPVAGEERGGTTGTSVGGGDQTSTVTVTVGGAVVARGVAVPPGAQPTNLACAIAVALLLGVDVGALARRLVDLPAVDHRLQAVRAESGATILDDTYNSNPAGAAGALRALRRCAMEDAVPATAAPRVVVVTPGMVELGHRQGEENKAFGKAIAGVATDLVVVGRTNRRALVAGAASAAPGTTVRLVADRRQAVEWVRDHLGAGDVVLYENDLPDHYP